MTLNPPPANLNPATSIPTEAELNTMNDAALIARAGVTQLPSSKITDMMRQWLKAKIKSPGAVVLFRMGDFYELFADDAVLAAPLLDLTLTSRDKNKSTDAVPMAGFQHQVAPSYIAKLIEQGFKVAICDQLEDPKLVKQGAIVKRGITRVVTPGTVFDEENLDAKVNNFLIAIGCVGNPAAGVHLGLAALDISTGEFLAASCPNEMTVIDEVSRLAAREVIIGEGVPLSPETLQALRNDTRLGQPRRIEMRPMPTAKQMGKKLPLLSSLPVPIDSVLAEPARLPSLVAAEMALAYVYETQGENHRHVTTLRPYDLSAQMLLDATTRQHLGLSAGVGAWRAQGSLLSAIDRTTTAAGSRRLLRFVMFPSTDLHTINGRHDRVGAFVDDPLSRAQVRASLSGIADIERIVGRIAAKRANPRDLERLGLSLRQIPDVARSLVESKLPLLHTWGKQIDLLKDLADLLTRAIRENAPTMLGTDDYVFCQGYDEELDKVVALSTGGREQIAAMEEAEKANTGINSLKIRYTSVFGYYIEVTKTNLSKVPAHYQRKQTISTGERYITDELKKLEEDLETAETKRQTRERELFDELCQKLLAQSARLTHVADQLADLDALASFSELADERHYNRPRMLPAAEKLLHVEDGRHPVVEVAMSQRREAYVPCSIELSGKDRSVVVVTGPNMAGKSTLMRAVALIQILAQAGSFVPAKSAALSISDRIFTRVGASDDLSSGRSTFMVEMTETSHILHNATPYSLVLLDEVGRGTSTYDGLSIAWSVAEYLHEAVGARTLFATHYHEMTQLSEYLPRLKNVHVVVKEQNDGIIFTHTLADGGAERSYGIHVARLAGLPSDVVARAQRILHWLEGEDQRSDEDTQEIAKAEQLPKPRARRGQLAQQQMNFFQSAPPAPPPVEVIDPAAMDALELVRRLAALDANTLTPIGALQNLSVWIDEAKRIQRKK